MTQFSCMNHVFWYTLGKMCLDMFERCVHVDSLGCRWRYGTSCTYVCSLQDGRLMETKCLFSKYQMWSRGLKPRFYDVHNSLTREAAEIFAHFLSEIFRFWQRIVPMCAFVFVVRRKPISTVIIHHHIDKHIPFGVLNILKLTLLFRLGLFLNKHLSFYLQSFFSY